MFALRAFSIYQNFKKEIKSYQMYSWLWRHLYFLTIQLSCDSNLIRQSFSLFFSWFLPDQLIAHLEFEPGLYTNHQMKVRYCRRVLTFTICSVGKTIFGNRSKLFAGNAMFCLVKLVYCSHFNFCTIKTFFLRINAKRKKILFIELNINLFFPGYRMIMWYNKFQKNMLILPF